MTRINADIEPKELKRVHLIAEYREITMVPAALRRSMRTKSKESILESIPKNFTLNAGHVKFFYNKQGFLIRRFNALVAEMNKRGYKYDLSRADAFLGFDDEFNLNWDATEAENDVVRERIALRISQKPHLYKD